MHPGPTTYASSTGHRTFRASSGTSHTTTTTTRSNPCVNVRAPSEATNSTTSTTSTSGDENSEWNGPTTQRTASSTTVFGGKSYVSNSNFLSGPQSTSGLSGRKRFSSSSNTKRPTDGQSGYESPSVGDIFFLGPNIMLPQEIDQERLYEMKTSRHTDLRQQKDWDADTETELEKFIEFMDQMKSDEKYCAVNSLAHRYSETRTCTSYTDKGYALTPASPEEEVDLGKTEAEAQRRLRVQDFIECEHSVEMLLLLRRVPLRYIRTIPAYAMLDVLGCLNKFEKDLDRLERADNTGTETFDHEKAERVFKEEVTVEMCIQWKELDPNLRKRNLSYVIACKEVYDEYKEIVDRIHEAPIPDEGLKSQFKNVYPEKEKVFYLMETCQIMCWTRTLWFLRSLPLEHASNVLKFLDAHKEHLEKLGRFTEIKDEGIYDLVRTIFNALVPERQLKLEDGFDEGPDENKSTNGAYVVNEDGHPMTGGPEMQWPLKWIPHPNTEFPDYDPSDHLKHGLLGEWKAYQVIAELLKLSTHELQLVFENLSYCEFLPFWKTRIVLQFFSSAECTTHTEDSRNTTPVGLSVKSWKMKMHEDCRSQRCACIIGGYWEEMILLNRDLNSCTPIFDKENVFHSQDNPHDTDVIDPEPGYGTNNFCDLTYYQMLGVPSSARDHDIQRAYRKKAKAYHPDKYNENSGIPLWNDHENVMKLLNEARDVLLEEDERVFYDHFGKKN